MPGPQHVRHQRSAQAPSCSADRPCLQAAAGAHADPRRSDFRPVVCTGRRPSQSACLSIVVWPWQRTDLPRTARVRSGQDLTTGDRDVRSHHRRALGSGGDLQASNVRRVADRLGPSRWTASRWVMERSGRMLADPPFGTPARCEPCSATAAQIRWYCGRRSVWWLTAPSAPQAGAAHRRSCSAVGLLVLAGWAFLVAEKWLELRGVAVEDPS
jgi:hypothetical protein